MAKYFFAALACTFVLTGLCTPLSALEQLSVAGNSYSVVMICLDDAGDYCDQNELNYEGFSFDDGEDFELETFEENLWGYGGQGRYYEEGSSFKAGYEAYNEDFEKYEFGIGGINLSEGAIAGIMQIEYYEWDLFDFEKEDEAVAYFVGIKQ